MPRYRKSRPLISDNTTMKTRDPGYFHSEIYRTKSNKKGKYKYANRKATLLKYYQANKSHLRARGAVRQALLKGELVKLPCEKCGVLEVHAHHHAGYEKENWLTVTWLCNEHHRQAHHGK